MCVLIEVGIKAVVTGEEDQGSWRNRLRLSCLGKNGTEAPKDRA